MKANISRLLLGMLYTGRLYTDHGLMMVSDIYTSSERPMDYGSSLLPKVFHFSSL